MTKQMNNNKTIKKSSLEISLVGLKITKRNRKLAKTKSLLMAAEKCHDSPPSCETGSLASIRNCPNACSKQLNISFKSRHLCVLFKDFSALYPPFICHRPLASRTASSPCHTGFRRHGAFADNTLKICQLLLDPERREIDQYTTINNNSEI